jgi:hypothetical protein
LFNLNCNFKHPRADVPRPLTPGGLIEKMAGQAGMPAWPIVRAETIRQDVLEAENRRPTPPGLASAPEVAGILQVSPQRVHELAASYPQLPEPMCELRTGKLWLRYAIEAFAALGAQVPAGRPRQPGLPAYRLRDAKPGHPLAGLPHIWSLTGSPAQRPRYHSSTGQRAAGRGK